MHFTLLNEKDFFNPYYRKKQILKDDFEKFSKILSEYMQILCEFHEQNEDYLVANALACF